MCPNPVTSASPWRNRSARPFPWPARRNGRTVAGLADILRRFRFHGVPGPPGALGVPADRAAEVARELEPVFAALDGAQRRARHLVAAAESDAAHLRSEGIEQARRIVAEARAGAGRARADAAASHLALAATVRARMVAAARSESDRIGDVTAERLPVTCRSLVERVLTSLAGGRPPSSGGKGSGGLGGEEPTMGTGCRP